MSQTVVVSILLVAMIGGIIARFTIGCDDD